MLSARQLEERKNYIGASEAAAVVGLSYFKTPLQVWAEKTGRVQPDDISDKLPVKLGNMLEDAVAQLFMEDTGKKVHRVNETLYHPRHPFLAVNLDRRVVGEDAILECKTVNAWRKKEFEGEELPQEHILQVVHALAVTGKKRGYLAALIGNERFVVKTIDRDEQMIRNLITREVAFWNDYVVKDVPPQQVTAYDDPVLQKLFPRANQATMNLNPDTEAICEVLEAYKADRRNLDELIEQKENELKMVMGDHEVAASSRWIASWKNQLTARIDTKALKADYPEIAKAVTKEAASRVLRVKHLEGI